MAKKIQAMVKLQIPAGKATPAPPVGPALGQQGQGSLVLPVRVADRPHQVQLAPDGRLQVGPGGQNGVPAGRRACQAGPFRAGGQIDVRHEGPMV